MYQPFPSRGGMPDRTRPEPPSTVRAAVWLMYAGAAVTALNLIATLVTVSGVRTAIHNARPSLTPAELHTAVVTYVVADVIYYAVCIGLWVWMALANRAGKSWARIGATVLFGVGTLLLAFGIGRSGLLVSSVVSLVIWLIGLGTVVFLWRRESSDFFRAASPKAP